MRKNQIKAPVFYLSALLVISVFGFFFRWLQNINAFEPDTGYLIPGSATTTVVFVYFVLAVAAFAVFAFRCFQKNEFDANPNAAFHDGTQLSKIIIFAASIATAVAGVIIAIGSANAQSPTLTKLLGVSCVVLAIGYTAYPQGKDVTKKTGYLTILPVLFSFVWLIAGYKFNAYNPVVWSYTAEILAICSSAAAFQYICGYFYGRAKPKTTLFLSMVAAFFDITTIADSHSKAYSVIFIFAAVVFVTMSFLLLKNRSEKEAEGKTDE